jgi:hypothetical protein
MIIDFMPVDGASDLVRIVRGLSGTVRFQTELVLRFDYGSTVPWVTRNEDGTIEAIAGPERTVLRTSANLHGEDLKTVGDFTVDVDQAIWFVLSYGRSFERPPDPIDPFESLECTEAFWREWSDRCPEVGPWTEVVKRSLITLKALTYAPSGGIVAAATTSLPECLGGTRNWDYRFCWLRDATFTLLAFLHSGYDQEARAWSDWLFRAVAGSPEQIQIVYGVGGERRLPELVIPWLSGYEDSAPVRVGNAASQQLQIDIFGEIADALFWAFRSGVQPSKRGEAVRPVILEYLATAWRLADDGIWEVRGNRQHFVYSKVMAWVAFDRAAALAEAQALHETSHKWRKIATKSTLMSAAGVSIASSAPLCRLMAPSDSTRACYCYRSWGSCQPMIPAFRVRFKPSSKSSSSTMNSFCVTNRQRRLMACQAAKEHFWSAVFGSSTITSCRVAIRKLAGCLTVCSRVATTLACWQRNLIPSKAECWAIFHKLTVTSASLIARLTSVARLGQLSSALPNKAADVCSWQILL